MRISERKQPSRENPGNRGNRFDFLDFFAAIPCRHRSSQPSAPSMLSAEPIYPELDCVSVRAHRQDQEDRNSRARAHVYMPSAGAKLEFRLGMKSVFIAK